jgi:ferredoxin-NADP reductase
MPTTWYNGEVFNIIDESPLVKRFFLKVKEVESFTFKAGQFITLDLPVSDKRINRWRSYSIANAPFGDNVLELCIVRKFDGIASSYLFENIIVGSELKFKGPDGNFILPENISETNLVLICTGTGIAPFRSMIQHIKNHNLKYKSIHLIFGARYENDILYRQEFENLDLPDFTYDVALSRAENWKGYKGYVHDVYLQSYQNKNANTKFLLCGWTAMIDQAVENLILKLGFDKSQVMYELYG